MKKLMITTAQDFAKPFIERGLVPVGTTRIIIDAKLGDCVRLLYETYADPEIIDAILDAKLEVKESIDE